MKKQLRWKCFSPKYSTLTDPVTYKWDNHTVIIIRDENNNWLTASLDGGAFVTLNNPFSINDVAKQLGIY